MEKLTIIGGRPVTFHGRTFIGMVTSDRMMSTVTVEWNRRRHVAKFQRYEKRKSKVKAHNPKELHAKTGDRVRVMETRPISKTKHFVVVEILGTEDKIEPNPEQSKVEPPKKIVKTAKTVAKNKATPSSTEPTKKK